MADREEDKEREKGFRVVDRRRFTSEGEVRPDVPERSETPEPAGQGIGGPAATPRAAQPGPEQRAGREARRPEGRGPSRGAESGPRQPARPPPEPEPEAEPPSGIDFLSFVASLATNALAALGLLPDEQARGLPRNPELAREYIDILAMLQQKTRGNLTRQEDAALAQMLSDLRLQYVEATRGPRR